MRRTVKNGRWSVEVITDGGQGPLLVLLPSWGRDSEELEPLAASLADAGLRVLRPVPRGVGASDGPVEGVTMLDLAGDVIAAIEAEGGGPAIVAGHAFGSYLARAVAALRPDLVSGVALLATGQRAPVAPDLVEAVLKSGDLSLPAEERLGYLRHVFFAPGSDPTVWLGGWHARTGEACASAFRTPPHSDYWQAGGRPVLDLIAAEDPMRPRETYDDIRDDLGGDRVSIVVVEDASHAVVLEQPAAVVEALLAFVRSLAGSDKTAGAPSPTPPAQSRG